ncbi:MAG: hypothetical protein OXF56_23945 [Rhodobacteraceae bacterium]|nr:hypothetical protein [Paracoccaceae bacterium]
MVHAVLDTRPFNVKIPAERDQGSRIIIRAARFQWQRVMHFEARARA